MASRPTKLVTLFNEADEDAWVLNREFEDSMILGPAVIAPFEAVTFEDITISGSLDAALIEIPTGKTLQGVIGLRHVTFRRCWLMDIAIIGPPGIIAECREALQVLPSELVSSTPVA
ncbi:MAG TPA: hypothetical protein VK272_12125 [Solirubrobacteraceae bacterium]|nr:hypothetical protein [Solirubrobacteraceae bacterium]